MFKPRQTSSTIPEHKATYLSTFSKTVSGLSYHHIMAFLMIVQPFISFFICLISQLTQLAVGGWTGDLLKSILHLTL